MAVKQGPGRPAKEKDQSSIQSQTVDTGKFDPLAPIEFDGPEMQEHEESEGHDAEAVLPKSEVMALLKAQEEKFMEMLKAQQPQQQVVYVQGAPDQQASKSTYVKDLVDDYLDDPEIYFAYSSGLFIHGDYRNGKESLPPNGSIEFKPVIRMRRASKTGGQQTISVSSAKIHSKAQAEWIKNHTLAEIRFYRQVEEVANVDALWATKLIEANTSIAKLNDVQIIARCKDMGIRITEDVPSMRRQLVNKIAQTSKSLEDKINAEMRQEIAGRQAVDVDGDVALRHVVQH